ncbi:MAG: condensation domain-containing protein, partial [Planctomycetota bacterium]
MSAPQDSEPGANVGTTVSLKQRLADLPPEKLTLLQKRLQGQQRLADGPTRMLGDDTIHPLSFHQQRLWFIEQFQPGTPRYNITRAIRMVGPLNRRALRSALQALVDRHEALRTTFEIMDDEPVQRINPPPELRLPIVELQPPGGDPQGIDSLLDERLTAEGRRPFNLSADPMLRAVLYRSDDNHHVLQLTIHHLACDGWSLGLLFQDLAVLYRNACLDEVAALPRAAIRYVDFARWQREPRQKELFAERIGWWRHQLAGAPQVLELPTDRPRPPIESGEGDARLLDIPGELLQQLEMLGREEGVTLYMTLLAGFFILLHRYTGLTDFVVGSAIAGRHRAETHELVGFFVDTVALRADLAGEPTPREVLRRVRRTVVEAMENSDVPFDRVVEAMDVPKDLSRHPLFQVLFNIPPQYTLEFHRLEVSPVHINMRASRFDLEVTYSDGVNQPSRITWNTDLFEASTIERMAGHLVTLLKGIIFDPDRPIGQLPLMTDAERQRLLVEWNATDAPYPSDKCVHELFEEQALRTPNAVAVVFREEQLSYRELNERANQLAHHLRALGVGPECLVGLCLERSLNLAVGILGILKAGGAYVPLDPEYPADRIAFMLEDSAAAALVTEKALMERFGAFEG